MLVFSEQGFGDTIQFARYLPLLSTRRCRITFLTYPELVSLLRPVTGGIEVITTLPRERNFDFQCGLMSLPHRFGTDLSSIPNSVPYLKAEADVTARWNRRLDAYGFRIGIAWQCNPLVDFGRSIPLREFLPLTRSAVRLISLQKDHGREQLASVPSPLTIEDLGAEFADFADTAAAIVNLDLVITTDTSIAHLSGALGQLTWVVLKHVPAWRWMLDRDDSPWYPTMRIFRQPSHGDWQSAFAQIKVALEQRLVGRGDIRWEEGTPP